MKVRLLVDTSTPLNGYVRVGDVVDVDDATCQRWLDHHIAEFANSEPEEVANAGVLEKTNAEPDEVKKPSVPKKKKKSK